MTPVSPQELALTLFAVAPVALGGLRLRARAGAAREDWLTALRDALPPETPWCRLPARTDDDALHGNLDLGATLAAGRLVTSRGLLERAQGGIVVAAMAERMSAALAARLAQALDGGHTALLLLDEGIEDDEQPPAALLDRVALHVALGPRDPAPQSSKARCQVASAAWPQVQVNDPLFEALVGACAALGVDSTRAACHAVVATRIAAALDVRPIAGADDAALAVQAVLAPRATRPAPQAEVEAHEPEPPPPNPENDADDQNAPADAAALADQLIEAAYATLPPDLLRMLGAGTSRSRSGEAGRVGSAARSRDRGRPIGAQRGEPRRGARLALIETLRCAAPWQPARRAAAGSTDGRVIVRRDDLRVQRREQKRSTTTIFAVDASGSQAMHRLAEAKGAVELLLADCYARRDRVAVIGFRGERASLLLPPTRSLVRARRSLAGLPGGGGTPLACGLDAARALAQAVSRAGSTPLVVLLTDGRANVTRRGEPGREQASTEAMAAARLLASDGIGGLLIDTADHPSRLAQALADAMRASYLPLPHAGARALSVAVRRERDDPGSGARRG